MVMQASLGSAAPPAKKAAQPQAAAVGIPLPPTMGSDAAALAQQSDKMRIQHEKQLAQQEQRIAAQQQQLVVQQQQSKEAKESMHRVEARVVELKETILKVPSAALPAKGVLKGAKCCAAS